MMYSFDIDFGANRQFHKICKTSKKEFVKLFDTPSINKVVISIAIAKRDNR